MTANLNATMSTTGNLKARIFKKPQITLPFMEESGMIIQSKSLPSSPAHQFAFNTEEKDKPLFSSSTQVKKTPNEFTFAMESQSLPASPNNFVKSRRPLSLNLKLDEKIDLEAFLLQRKAKMMKIHLKETLISEVTSKFHFDPEQENLYDYKITKKSADSEFGLKKGDKMKKIVLEYLHQTPVENLNASDLMSELKCYDFDDLMNDQKLCMKASFKTPKKRWMEKNVINSYEYRFYSSKRHLVQDIISILNDWI